MKSGPRVLALYRAILRLGRTWSGEGGQEEKEYILTETRRVFRENKAVSSEKEVAQLIEEAEHRLNYAQHYGIAYPRLHHASQFKRRVYMDVPQQGGSGANISLPSDTDTAAKLAAAMQRRREKLERRNE